MFDMLLERHPYLVAQDRFLKGELHTLSAAAMVARDPDFIAQVEMSGKHGLGPDAVMAAAIAVVRDVWVPCLVAHTVNPVLPA